MFLPRKNYEYPDESNSCTAVTIGDRGREGLLCDRYEPDNISFIFIWNSEKSEGLLYGILYTGEEKLSVLLKVILHLIVLFW